MRELTDAEQAELKRRKEKQGKFLAERLPVLADFAERLELPNSIMIVNDPASYLPAIDDFMRDQIVEPEDRAWIMTRIGYFIGELLVQRQGGCWFLNEIPDSRFFLRYVVGKFRRGINPYAMVDPFNVADEYLAELPGQSLQNIVNEVESELLKA